MYYFSLCWYSHKIQNREAWEEFTLCPLGLPMISPALLTSVHVTGCTTQLLGLQKAGFILAGSSFHPCFTPTQQRHGACLCGPHNSLVFQNDIISFSCEQHHSSSTQGWLKSTGRTSHPRKAVEAMGAVQRLGRSWEQGGTSVDEASGCALGIPFIRDIALLQLWAEPWHCQSLSAVWGALGFMGWNTTEQSFQGCQIHTAP